MNPPDAAAYDPIAKTFQEYSNSNAWNAYCERPTTLSLMPDVRGKTVLDAACGPGFYSAWCLEQGAIVFAFDGSAQMVRLAQEELGPTVSLRQADLGQPLTFIEDASCDVVVCALAIDYVPNMGAVFAEFYRVLRSPGQFVFSVEHPQSVFRRAGQHYFATELVARESATFKMVLEHYRRPLHAYFDALASAGFQFEHLKEATAIAACEQKHPELYERLNRRPSFLSFRALKDDSR